MAVPEIISIAYEPDYRTDKIGRYADGQFFASITYAFPEGFRHGEGWEDAKRLYVVLHRFDADGRYIDSDIWYAGTWREQQQRPYGADSVLAQAEARLAELLDALPKREYQDIAIRPFRLTVDGVLFGLIIEQGHGENEDEDDWAELYPDHLGFCEPWDGEYST
ncbi:hypothetical protein [Actinomadura sp. HBU206391]|uniref:hypothetical protein n=1 Tax=Actinomadura sp. HBU206391 TaxID=2731692 RepID=UPI00164F26E5|nr:hypothetical protein [Actinomadura sp. HBU206391]MBC6458689.1 hypothetical protein [Actinomadura sp. HBU206391]